MSEPNSPGESRRGAPRFFVGYEDDESEALDDSMRTDMELYEDDEDTDSVGALYPNPTHLLLQLFSCEQGQIVDVVSLLTVC